MSKHEVPWSRAYNIDETAVRYVPLPDCGGSRGEGGLHSILYVASSPPRPGAARTLAFLCSPGHKQMEKRLALCLQDGEGRGGGRGEGLVTTCLFLTLLTLFEANASWHLHAKFTSCLFIYDAVCTVSAFSVVKGCNTLSAKLRFCDT